MLDSDLAELYGVRTKRLNELSTSQFEPMLTEKGYLQSGIQLRASHLNGCGQQR